jgi:hypothetical protein
MLCRSEKDADFRRAAPGRRTNPRGAGNILHRFLNGPGDGRRHFVRGHDAVFDNDNDAFSPSTNAMNVAPVVSLARLGSGTARQSFRSAITTRTLTNWPGRSPQLHKSLRSRGQFWRHAQAPGLRPSIPLPGPSRAETRPATVRWRTPREIR